MSPSRKDYVEIKSPALQQFERPGDSVVGKLIAIEEVVMGGKMVDQFILETPAGDRFKIHGTADLSQKLRDAHVGREVFIEYLGENKAVTRNGNPMKDFFVGVK